MSRASVAVVAALALAFVAAASWFALGPETSGESASGDAATSGSDAASAGGRPRRGTAQTPPKPRARARRAGEIEPSGDPLWDDARRDAAAGRHLEALERIVAERRRAAPAWTAADRVAEIVPWEDAALDRFEAAVAAIDLKERGAWLRRLDAAILDPARRRRLDAIRRALVESGRMDLASILDAASAESRAQIERHLKRFARDAAGSVPADTDDHVDTLLRAVRARAAARPQPVAPLETAGDDAGREQRRLEQLEKLRQRDATGLLGPIAAGLAWLALHQADDGEVSDRVVASRCAFLGHTLCTGSGAATTEANRIAETSLAILAWLDFRDQDLAATFEPSLSLAVSWVRKQMRKDGSFEQPGYVSAIALMALGQAARQSGSAAVRADVERGLRFVASKQSADGGFRYSWGQAGDLSVTGWYAQAWEQARDAGIPVAATLAPGIEKFVRSVWSGGAGFRYEAQRPQPWESLSGVGMLSLQLVAPKEAEAQAEAWTAALAKSAGRSRDSLYMTYYEVRTELALTGRLTPARHALLVALPDTMQEVDPSGAGMFAASPVRGPDGKVKQPAPHGWRRLGHVGDAGRTASTAFAVLTMEHALYRR